MFHSIMRAQEELAGWSNRTWLHVSSNFEFIQHSIGWLVGRLSSHAIFASPSPLSSVSRQSSRTACCALLRHPPRGSVSLAAREGERATLPRPPQPPPPDHPPSHASAAPTSQPPKYGPTDHALVVPIPTASLTNGRSAGKPASQPGRPTPLAHSWRQTKPR